MVLFATRLHNLLPAGFKFRAVAVALNHWLGQDRAIACDEWLTKLKPVSEILFNLIWGCHSDTKM